MNYQKLIKQLRAQLEVRQGPSSYRCRILHVLRFVEGALEGGGLREVEECSVWYHIRNTNEISILSATVSSNAILIPQ